MLRNDSINHAVATVRTSRSGPGPGPDLRAAAQRVDAVRSASKKFFSYVDGRARADCVEVGVDPTLGDLAADFLEMQQEIHAGVELARHAQPSHLTLRFDPVHIDTL